MLNEVELFEDDHVGRNAFSEKLLFEGLHHDGRAAEEEGNAGRVSDFFEDAVGGEEAFVVAGMGDVVHVDFFAFHELADFPIVDEIGLLFAAVNEEDLLLVTVDALVLEHGEEGGDADAAGDPDLGFVFVEYVGGELAIGAVDVHFVAGFEVYEAFGVVAGGADAEADEMAR